MAARNKVSFLPNETCENKATTEKRNAAPCFSVLEKFLKEWSYDICQVKTSSNENLRDHLRGKKHKKKHEEIKANKMAAKIKGISKQNDIEELTLGSKMLMNIPFSFLEPSRHHNPLQAGYFSKVQKTTKRKRKASSAITGVVKVCLVLRLS
ncbi:hypothetical protein GIB67_042437 [Kingdonia uniflora]|uniref:C2H2-type domain-containing protein n=1 Tax=Kingdonia uniflora TaxID=39325 RepID=A0A7J7M8D3_9MAGN|nr:hypothetical protein GIB67_042437 [Kingdonia uniflora]